MSCWKAYHRALLAVAAVLLVAGGLHAQDMRGTVTPPSVDVRTEPARLQLEAGKPADLTVRISLPIGYHAYLDAGKDGVLLPIKISFHALAQAGMLVRSVSVPKGEQDEQFRATVLRREGVFRYALTALPAVKAGKSDYAITVRSQICNDATGACNFPRTDTLRLQLDVVKAPAGQVDGGSASPPEAPVPDDRSKARSTGKAANNGDSPIKLPHYTARTDRPSHGLLVWMLLAFVAGLLLNIMPCVLPVVSIKVLSLVQQAGESRRRALGLGLVFAAGMMTVFLALAVVAILFGLGWGEQFQSQTFLIVMITIVFAFALSLFGVYELGVPQAVGSLAAHTTREGFGSAFLKGVLATVLATPCSGPFLGGTLAWTLTQPPIIVLLIFGMLGFGMALPYVILAIHPAFLRRLPKPGPWMETFKHVMGFLLLATVVYLMVSLNQQFLLFTIIFLFCVAVGGWIWGRFSMRPVTSMGRAAVLATVLLVIIAGAFLSFHTLRGVIHPLGAEKGEPLAWEPFDPARLLHYHREGRSVLLDFTANWCANCQFNELRVYNSPQVRRLLREKQVVAMKADLTNEGPETAAIRHLMTQLGARSIPFLAVFPGDQFREPYTLYDLVDKKTVSHILEVLPDAKAK